MLRLGCVADDFTGGSDVASALRRAGLSVTLQFDVPDDATPAPATDAVVVALKSRTIEAAAAVAQTCESVAWLQSHEVESVYFKYCSTFDSTDEGNIGPVADALRHLLGEPMTLVCPASPEHGRTTYRGHLFVGDRLLSESSMRHHPLTPMTDPDLVRIMARQTNDKVDLLPLTVVQAGREAVETHLAQLREDGVGYVVVDAVTDDDLRTVAAATVDWRLHTGAAGLAGALASVVSASASAVQIDPLPNGPTLILAGSCSAATLAQVGAANAVFASHRLDPVRTPDPAEMRARAAAWLSEHWGEEPLLIYSSAGAEDRAKGMAVMGPETPSVLEVTLAELARQAAEMGAARIVVAGGETSGAVVQALGLRTVTVTGEADRGVPWCLTGGSRPMALLLKSGNFGSEDLLVRATKES